MSVWSKIFSGEYDEIASRVVLAIGAPQQVSKERAYYTGNQKKPLKVPYGKTDDNIIANLITLVIDRSISHMLAGFDFEFPADEESDSEEATESAQAQYLEAVWDANKERLLLYNAALSAAVHGTGYIEIIPDGVQDPYTGNAYPRLLVHNPEYCTIQTNPQDGEEVWSYKIEYSVGDTAYRHLVRRTRSEDMMNEENPDLPYDGDVPDTWIIEDFKFDKNTGNDWKLTDTTEWPYNFPSIAHWKNLPSLNDVYGSGDADDIYGLQDSYNAMTSFTAKQARLQSYKQLIGQGVTKDQLKETGPDKMILTGPDATINALDLQTDITGTSNFANTIRQTSFDIAREVDTSSLADRLGALTNFGLRVLYSDSLSKCETKRDLFGEMLMELNRRLLVLDGYEGEASRPGSVRWGDPLPVNIAEDVQVDISLLNAGLVDPQTVYARYESRYGADWEEIKARMDEGKAAQSEGDLGAMMLRLRQFNMGGGNQNGNE